MSVSVPRPRQVRAPLLGALAGVAVLLQFPGTLLLSSLSAVLALSALAYADRRALRRLWKPHFWVLTAVVALLAGALLSPPTHVVGPVPVSLGGTQLAAVVILRALALLAVVTLGVSHLTEARLVAFAARLGLPALGSASYRAMALLPGFVAAWRAEWSVVRGSGWIARGGEAAVALLVRATQVAEGERLPPDPAEPHVARVAAPGEATLGEAAPLLETAPEDTTRPVTAVEPP